MEKFDITELRSEPVISVSSSIPYRVFMKLEQDCAKENINRSQKIKEILKKHYKVK